jgi:Domain of unknown function (DUF1996)
MSRSSCARRVAVAVVAAAAVAAPLGAAAPARPKPKLHGNNFFSNCLYSHTAADDPIVLPGLRGRSHSHTFFGNVTTDAYSTLASLRKGATTCKPRTDHAAYWVPTLYQNGREVRPAKAQLYYVLRGYDQMHPFPPGLRMVAGDAHATRPQSMRVTYWTCGGRAARTAPSSTVPARCGVIEGRGLSPRGPHEKAAVIRWRTRTFLELHVDFPDCWDGVHLDSPDHHSHMAYSRDYVCPRSHPVKVPLIRLTIRYPIDRGRGVLLASGGRFSGHADFFNAWDPQALARLVDDCFHGRPCR